jgi:TonB family protein
MRILLFILPIIASFNLNAQAKVTKYYNAAWLETSKDKAAFYADFVKEGDNYSCTSYYINTSIVRGKSIYPDTLMQSPIGAQILYFKNGHTEDSSYFENNELKYQYVYYANNKLMLHYYLPANKKEGVAEGYDESGEKIKNYIFEKEAEFKGGQKGWANYIIKNAAGDLQVKSDTVVTANVVVEFIVDENGDVIKAKILKSSGYKIVDNDALRLIGDSPPWNCAIQYNKPVKAYRRQPITYMLKPEKK